MGDRAARIEPVIRRLRRTTDPRFWPACILITHYR
jgi:hypothetical protein